MKRISLLAASVLALLTSCTTFKEYDKETKKMRDNSATYFVVRDDGRKVTGTNFRQGTDKTTGKASFFLDNEAVPLDKVQAYQDKTAYYEKTDKGAWAKLLRRGKIKLYYFDVRTTTGFHTGAGGSQMADSQADDHFAFAKGDEAPRELTRREIADLLKDNQKAYSKFTSIWKPDNKLLPKSYALHLIINVIDIYNS
jgi:hypothetical protein